MLKQSLCMYSLAVLLCLGSSCMQRDDDDPRYYSIPRGVFLSPSGMTQAVHDSISRFIFHDSLTGAYCSTGVKTTGTIPCNFTNFGASALYEYLVLDTDTLVLEGNRIGNPVAVYWEDSSATGFALESGDSLTASPGDDVVVYTLR